MAKRSRIQKMEIFNMCDWANYKKNHHVQWILVWGGLWLWWIYWSIFLCNFIWRIYLILHRRGYQSSDGVPRNHSSCCVFHHRSCQPSYWIQRTFDGRESTKIESDISEGGVTTVRLVKNCNKDVFFNRLLESVVNHLTISWCWRRRKQSGW